jgi:hypothetical protein
LIPIVIVDLDGSVRLVDHLGGRRVFRYIEKSGLMIPANDASRGKYMPGDLQSRSNRVVVLVEVHPGRVVGLGLDRL